MIKILFVVCSNEVNGTEKTALKIAEGLDKNKFDVYFAIPEDGYISEILRKKSIKKIVFSNDKLDTFSFKGMKNLLRAIRKYRFDIVHSHASSIPGLLGNLSKVKLTIETRNGLFYSDGDLQRLSFKKKLLERIKARLNNVITLVSFNDKNRLINFFNYDKNKLEVVYNSVDTDGMENIAKERISDKQNFDNQTFLIGNVGRLSYQKNHELLMNVFSKLVNKFPNLRLQIIGDGELKNDILNQIKELNLTDKVELIPYQKNIYDYISKFDLMVMTSRYEGVPLVILEAMAIGTPILSSDVGGINEIIKDGETGSLIHSLNEDEYVNKISELINNPHKLDEISSKALKEIQNFSVENMVINYENLYLKHLKR